MLVVDLSLNVNSHLTRGFLERAGRAAEGVKQA